MGVGFREKKGSSAKRKLYEDFRSVGTVRVWKGML